MVNKSRKANFGVQDSPAKMFPLLERDSGLGSRGGILASSISSRDYLRMLARLSSFSKTSQAFYLPTAEEISESFSVRWQTSGMALRGACLTANTSAFPSHVEDCTLLDIVQTRPEQPQYYLSPNAAQGILRRAAVQGRPLFLPLKRALEKLAAGLLSRDSDTV